MLDYRIAKLSDQVYEIQNFITEEELDQVTQFLSLTDESDWNVNDVQYDFWKNKVLDRKLIYPDSKFIDFYKRICSLFSGKVEVTGINLQRYKKGDAMGEHTDDHDGHRLNNQRVFYGAVLYYNDDYEGGELKYPDLDIIHKPKKGSLVLHGGSILHGTTPVKNDVTRYMSTVFVKHQVGEEVSLNKEIFGEE